MSPGEIRPNTIMFPGFRLSPGEIGQRLSAGRVTPSMLNISTRLLTNDNKAGYTTTDAATFGQGSSLLATGLFQGSHNVLFTFNRSNFVHFCKHGSDGRTKTPSCKDAEPYLKIRRITSGDDDVKVKLNLNL